MKLSIKFEAVAICNIYENEEGGELIERNAIVSLYLNDITAGHFLFRFGENAFEVDDYKIALFYNDNQFKGITLFKDNCIYIVKNINSFMSQVLTGFIKSRAMEKLSNIMEYESNDEEDHTPSKVTSLPGGKEAIYEAANQYHIAKDAEEDCDE